jgi:hypothetical protein
VSQLAALTTKRATLNPDNEANVVDIWTSCLEDSGPAHGLIGVTRRCCPSDGFLSERTPQQQTSYQVD